MRISLWTIDMLANWGDRAALEAGHTWRELLSHRTTTTAVRATVDVNTNKYDVALIVQK